MTKLVKRTKTDNTNMGSMVLLDAFSCVLEKNSGSGQMADRLYIDQVSDVCFFADRCGIVKERMPMEEGCIDGTELCFFCTGTDGNRR